MSLTVIQMGEAVEGAEFIFTNIQAKTVPQNQVEVARYGANIVNFGAPFVIKDQPVPTPIPTPNPPVPAPVMKCPCTPDQKAKLEKCVSAMTHAYQIKPGQKGSMLSVLLAALWPQILAALEAILANIVKPQPAPSPPVTPSTKKPPVARK